MADTRLTEKVELTTPDDGDWFHIVDVSDTTGDPAGTSKKIQKQNIKSGKFIDGTDPNDAVYTGGDVGIGTDAPNDSKLEIVNTDPTKAHLKISKTVSGNGDICSIANTGQVSFKHTENGSSTPAVGVFRTTTGLANWFQLRKNGAFALDIKEDIANLYQIKSFKAFDLASNDGSVSIRATGDDGVGINTINPDNSAALDVTFITTPGGFLPPRMTGTQAEAISTPAEGLMVYSTDGSGATITTKGWWGYDGTTWVKLN